MGWGGVGWGGVGWGGVGWGGVGWGGVGWGGDDNVQVKSKTDLRILQTKGWVGWGGVGMITYRSRARQT